jgi:hypothetical protein
MAAFCSADCARQSSGAVRSDSSSVFAGGVLNSKCSASRLSSSGSDAKRSSLVQGVKDGAHCLLKRREISRDNIPDCLKVHFKIVVYQDVPHAGYRRPVDLRVPLLVRFVDPLCRLAENLKVADDCVLERARGEYSIPARRRILSDSAYAFDDMLDIRALRFHNSTASRSTESRIRGLNERRITTCTRRPRSCSRSATRLPGNHGVVSPVTSTRRSTSLSRVSSPRATEPKRWTLPAPWRVATRRISSRRSLMR